MRSISPSTSASARKRAGVEIPVPLALVQRALPAIAFGIALQKYALGDTERPAAYFAGIVEKARTGRRCDLNASIRGLAEHVHTSSDVEDRVPSRTPPALLADA